MKSKVLTSKVSLKKVIKKVILFYKQQPIDNNCKIKDFKLFRY